MFKRIRIGKTGLSLPDLLAFAFLLATFLAILAVARYWSGPLSPPQPIDLSLSSLPYAVFLSASRIVLAYIICLATSLAIGYWAAHSKLAEKIIVPLIDIGQSVPVLTFLPGLVLAFLALFPESRIGLEIAAILTLYTGMAWNLMLAFYGSIKTIPREYAETVRAYGYGPLGTLLRLELPYSMSAIVWNSMLSVAGGWFFLTVCESYTLGDRSFSLVGLGSFMALAATKGDYLALGAGVSVMVALLVLTDYFVWNPLLRWAERFQKMQQNEEGDEDLPVLNFFAKSKRITDFVRKMRRKYAVRLYVNQRKKRKRRGNSGRAITAGYSALALFVLFGFWGLWKSFEMVAEVPWGEWIRLIESAAWTLLRVNAVVLLSGLMMVPIGIWLGTQPKLVKRLQPVIQVIAAFPAPMIFPVLTIFFVRFSIPLSVGSVVLMMMGAQWYLLFNVISGSAGVPEHLVEVARTCGMGKLEIMRRVYLPATFPTILTGLITAAGGAWNTSIVAELVMVEGKEYSTTGIGAYIARAAYNANYAELLAAVIVMIVLIVLVNRLFWARLYQLAESKYRMDG